MSVNRDIMKILMGFVFLVRKHVLVVEAQVYVLHASQGLSNQEICVNALKIHISYKHLSDIVNPVNRIVKFATKQEIV